MMRPIYLDNMATTPLDPAVLEAMLPFMQAQQCYGNAGSVHAFGRAAQQAIEQAAATVASVLHCQPEAVCWTSGATEANNLALFGVARFYHRKGRHIITTKTEHQAVLAPCRQLEREGFRVTYLTPDREGHISLADLEAAITDDTILISLMHVNNEIGVIHDVERLAALAHARNVVLHVDAAQSAGKLLLDLTATPIDLLSISAHKMYGPKGIGALIVQQKPRIRLQPLLYGGGQQGGVRSGTLPTQQIVGLAAALQRTAMLRETEHAHLTHLTARLWQGLQGLPAVTINGPATQRMPGHLNVSFAAVDSDNLRALLPEIMVSTGSACTATATEISHVLRAIGLQQEAAHSAIRFSLGRFNTVADVDEAVERITVAVNRLRAASLTWERCHAE